jgi:hypothetical protein
VPVVPALPGNAVEVDHLDKLKYLAKQEVGDLKSAAFDR